MMFVCVAIVVVVVVVVVSCTLTDTDWCMVYGTHSLLKLLVLVSLVGTDRRLVCMS